MTITTTDKVVELPTEGTLIVSSDLHGNMRDYLRIKELFEQTDNSYLLILGDLIHGPFFDVDNWPPELGSFYYDESEALIDDFQDLQAQHPGRVISLLGNHEHAHIGGTTTYKFRHPTISQPRNGRRGVEEQEGILDIILGEEKAKTYADYFRSFPLVATSAAGLVFTHCSPQLSKPISLEEIAATNYINLREMNTAERKDHLLTRMLWSRDTTTAEASRFLEGISDDNQDHYVIVFGHTPARQGYQLSPPNQLLLSTSYFMFDEHKTYLKIDLSGNYTSTEDFSEGEELRRLYPQL